MQLCARPQHTCICCFVTFCRHPGACGLASYASGTIGSRLIALYVLGLWQRGKHLHSAQGLPQSTTV